MIKGKVKEQSFEMDFEGDNGGGKAEDLRDGIPKSGSERLRFDHRWWGGQSQGCKAGHCLPSHGSGRVLGV